MSSKQKIQYRISRAKESLAASKDLIGDGYYFDATSRMYYACFYILLAYIHSKGLKAETHKGLEFYFTNI